ncbi:MurR/RpiR family transcriptional regulator, partial [Gammaproteobacteria bacterium]|nr:MurR/RpiR family transcriptional regulator [Gammaproteobacteria bacterium]
MPTKLLRHIKNTLPDLRKSEKIVGEFILADPKSIITMKTAEASSAMGISEPTLIRFCKALGFTGYQELKINLSQQLAADDYFVMYEIDQNDTIHELCEKVFDTTISEILNVRSQIDQNVLSDAIEILANAGRVEFYAFGGSAPVAMDGQHKFFRLKIPSSYISDPHIQFMSANSLGKDDVVVVISQSGTTSALID